MQLGLLGRGFIVGGLVVSLVAIVLYAVALRGNRRVLGAARAAFAAAGALAIGCFALLMWLVVHHQFQYSYVMEYSSADLTGPFLYAATWAGQQGSFLLWAVWTAVIGGLVAWKAGRWEARIMPVYVTALAFLFGILVWQSPFGVVPRGLGANQYPLDAPWPPGDGMGLNPSLQNYWMAIHPPTIFFGFASLLVPFCYAVAALVWREYESWAPRVMPWVLMTIATLGVGLFMGGYWAYETQGWHGFWAWDPVENASLFPWLCALALLHGLVVQKSRGGMARTNLFLAITGWLLFVYGTYLTRSGVLSNFSVHAFVSMANGALVLLIVMIAAYGIPAYVLWFARLRSVPAKAASDHLLSRDIAMVAAVFLMLATALFVALGTSWPLIAHSPTQPIFYNRFGSGILIIALVLMGVVPFLAWGKTNGEKLVYKVLPPWFTALAVGALLCAFLFLERRGGFTPDTPPVLVLVIGTLGAFAAFANLILTWRLVRTKAVTLGGWLSHVGIGVLFIGTVLANVYEKTDTFNLIQGNAPHKTPFGYALQYDGWTHDPILAQMEQAGSVEELNRLDAEYQKAQMRFDHALKIRVIPLRDHAGEARADDAKMGDIGSDLDSEHTFVTETPVFKLRPSQMMGQGQDAPTTMRWPSILKTPLRDFYIEVASDPEEIRAQATLRPSQTAPIGFPIEGREPTGYSVHYKSFYFDGQPGQPGTTMGAVLDVITPDGRKVEARPGLRLGGPNGPEPVNIQIPELHAVVHLEGGMDAATHQITASFVLQDAMPVWVVPVQVTNKPMINLVWLGVVLMGAGALVAMVRRALEARKGELIAVAAAAGVTDEPEPALAAPTNGRRSAGAKARAAARRP